MIEVGCIPNAYTFNSLIKGLCKERKLQEVELLFYNMVERGVILDEVIYGIFIDMYYSL